METKTIGKRGFFQGILKGISRGGIILPTIKLKVYTFGGLMNSATKKNPKPPALPTSEVSASPFSQGAFRFEGGARIGSLEFLWVQGDGLRVFYKLPRGSYPTPFLGYLIFYITPIVSIVVPLSG